MKNWLLQVAVFNAIAVLPYVMTVPMELAAAEAIDPPDGVGQVKFGMSLEVAKQRYPNLMPPQQSSGETPIEVHILPKQPVGTLESCNLYLRFVYKKLNTIEAYCGDKDKVLAYLTETYGPPMRKEGRTWHWLWSDAVINLQPALGIFTMANRQDSDALNAQLWLQMLAVQPEGTQATGKEATGASDSAPQAPAQQPAAAE
jgi:hypothetical protein